MDDFNKWSFFMIFRKSARCNSQGTNLIFLLLHFTVSDIFKIKTNVQCKIKHEKNKER